MSLVNLYNDVLSMGDKFETEKQWKERRFEGIGGTETSSILGFNKYKSAMELYFEKTTGVESFVDSFSARRGKVLEPLIADEYASITGYEVPDMSDNISFSSVSQPFSLATIDRLAWSSRGLRVVEIKTVGYRGLDMWDDGIPMMYRIQLQKYIAIIRELVSFIFPDYNKLYDPIVGDMVASMYDSEVVIYPDIECPPHIQKLLYNADRRFWDLVKAGTPPQPRTLDEIRLLWKDVAVKDVYKDADTDTIDHIRKLYSAKETINDMNEKHKKATEPLKKDIETHETHILNAIKDHQGIMHDDNVLVTWKPTKAGHRVLRLNKKNIDGLL